MKPKVVCLCGSTKFKEEFEDANIEESLNGNIVLSVGGFEYINIGQRHELEALHVNKIDLADEILVLNVGGYIGETTMDQIKYAKAHGKEVRYLEDADWQNKDYELEELELSDKEREEIKKGILNRLSDKKYSEFRLNALKKSIEDLSKQKEKSVEIVTILLDKLSELAKTDYEKTSLEVGDDSWSYFFDIKTKRNICDYITESISDAVPS